MNQFFQESFVKNINISHNHTKMKSLVVVILAAGDGTRMNSPLPKVLHSICGRPMIVGIVETALQLSPKKIVLVTGKHDQLIRGTVFSHLPESRKIVNVVVQTSPRGTGDAVKQTLPLFWPDDRVLILNGDMPLITRAILERFLNDSDSAVDNLLVARFQEPSGYGRVILCDDDREKIQQIVEEKDCTEEQRALNLVNTGIYLVSATTLKDRIPKIGSTNAQHEYYLTDIVQEGGFCAHILDPSESVYVRGVNTRAELEEAIAILQTFTA